MSDRDRVPLETFRRAVRAGIERDLAREAEIARDVRDAVLPKLREAISAARAHGALGRAWLFGSFTAAPREGSDVDVLVEGAPDPMRLAGELARATGTLVHVVDRATAAPSLVDRVAREGIEL